VLPSRRREHRGAVQRRTTEPHVHLPELEHGGEAGVSGTRRARDLRLRQRILGGGDRRVPGTRYGHRRRGQQRSTTGVRWFGCERDGRDPDGNPVLPGWHPRCPFVRN
jgi:hypothetical protein